MLPLIADDAPLGPEWLDHPLKGDWADHRECHIGGDFPPIYRLHATPSCSCAPAPTPNCSKNNRRPVTDRAHGQTGFNHLRKPGLRLETDGASAVERLRYV